MPDQVKLISEVGDRCKTIGDDEDCSELVSTCSFKGDDCSRLQPLVAIVNVGTVALHLPMFNDIPEC